MATALQTSNAESGGVGSMQGMQRLVVVVLKGLPELKQLTGLRECPALKAMQVSSCGRLQQLDLEGLASLLQLQITHCDQLQLLHDLETLRKLQELGLTCCPQLQRVNLQGLTALQRLEISACGAITEVPGLLGLGQLQRLLFQTCPELPEVDVHGHSDHPLNIYSLEALRTFGQTMLVRAQRTACFFPPLCTTHVHLQIVAQRDIGCAALL
jgi:hypothetical protein